jgi:serine/threonine protein kinase
MASDPTVVDGSQGGAADIPDRVGPYRIVRILGRGGMGSVYLGTRDDDQFKRRVAVKVIRRGMDTEDVLKRFAVERQILTALNHPGIARVFDAGETQDGRPYVVMEYIEGVNLMEATANKRLPLPVALEIIAEVASAASPRSSARATSPLSPRTSQNSQTKDQNALRLSIEAACKSA